MMLDIGKTQEGCWEEREKYGQIIKKNENGRELKTKGETERAYRLRLERTFNIGEEENEEF